MRMNKSRMRVKQMIKDRLTQMEQCNCDKIKTMETLNPTEKKQIYLSESG